LKDTIIPVLGQGKQYRASIKIEFNHYITYFLLIFFILYDTKTSFSHDATTTQHYLGRTAFIAISTALDDNNSYTILTKLEDSETGKPLFCVIRIGQVIFIFLFLIIICCFFKKKCIGLRRM
jgi:hypothetical protein